MKMPYVQSMLFLSLLVYHAWIAQAATPEQLFTLQPSVMPELSSPGQFTVGVKTIELINKKQISASDLITKADHSLTVEVWYPATADQAATRATYEDVTRSGKMFSLQGTATRNSEMLITDEKSPLIVLSHGYTGYRSLFFSLGEHLASRGYIVASIDHTDSTNKEIDFATAPGAGFLSTLLNRARDQQFVLDEMMRNDSPWARSLDAKRAAVLGFSMGGYGALNTAGGCYDFAPSVLASLGINKAQIAHASSLLNICAGGRKSVDPRWRAFVAIAPWGGEQNVHVAESLADIRIPGLFIAGELDDISGYQNGVAKLFSHTAGKDKYLLVYENARHNIATHPAPEAAFSNELDLGHYFEPAWHTETINRINNHMISAFLDCHVNVNEKNCEFLPARENSDQVKQADGSLSAPWPGFKDRWAVGLTFTRHDVKPEP